MHGAHTSNGKVERSSKCQNWWWAEVSTLWAFTFWGAYTLVFIGPTSYILWLAQEATYRWSPSLTKGFHVINLAFCMHGLEMNHFISFLFTFISFRLWSKPPFKFSLPHPLPSNLAYPHTKMERESCEEMCVFPKCEKLFSLSHTHTLKSNQCHSFSPKEETQNNRKAYLFFPLPLF